MAGDYAEPQQLQNFRIDVLPANSNTPILTKSANSAIFDVVPAPPGQLAVPNRNSDLGRPSNMPERQTSLRNDGQYRTIDVTPRTTAASPPPKLSSQIPNSLYSRYPAGVTEADVEGTLVVGKFVVGIIDQLTGKNTVGHDEYARRQRQRELFDPAEDAGYEIGRRIVDGGQKAVGDAKNTIEDLWRQRPTFEIPQIKIPQFDLPELPEFEIPDFPEFKFPEISFPKPQPLPKPSPKPNPRLPRDMEDLVRQTEGRCGKVSFFAVYVSYVTLPTNSNTFKREPGSLGGFLAAKKKWLESRFNNDPERLKSIGNDPKSQIEAGGGSGFTDVILNEPPRTPIVARFGIYQRIPEDGIYNPFAGTTLPFYDLNYAVVDVASGYSVGQAVDHMKSSYSPNLYSFQIYDFQTDSNAEGCVMPQPSPPPPPPPPEDDCCRMGCCPQPTQIDYRLIKRLIVESLKEQKFSINVPVCKCEFNQQLGQWEPKTSDVTLEVFATSKEQAEQVSKLHIENARQAADLCLARNETEVYASVPDYWLLRPEHHRPQMIIQFGEDLGEGKIGSPKYQISIPHAKTQKPNLPPLPSYKKGNYEMILVLSDNSKVTVNAFNEAEATTVINAAKQAIIQEYLTDSYVKGGYLKSSTNQLAEIRVIPKMAKYFPNGRKSEKPEWIKKFT